MARDCTVNKDPNAVAAVSHNAGKGFDSEYAKLMAELGESGDGARDGGRISGAGHDITAGGSNIPPWRRPEVWQSNTQSTQQGQTGYRPSGYPAGYSAQQWGSYPQGYGQTQDYQASYAQYYQQQYAQQQISTTAQ